MQERQLGEAGPDMSVLTFGNWLTHGDQVSQETALACVAAALDEGINTFDTADAYAAGVAERLLGEAGPAPEDRGLSRRRIVAACDASLRQLGTDYIDLYQAHRYDPQVPLAPS